MPLALALLNVSKPDINAMDTLSRLSHDADSEVAQSAILALGIIGAGVWLQSSTSRHAKLRMHIAVQASGTRPVAQPAQTSG